MTFRDQLVTMGACREALEWVGSRTIEEAWTECPNGSWLLWYAGRAGVDRRLLVMAACACARTALRYVPVGEDRPLRAIEAAESWVRGEATIDEVKAAALESARTAWATARAARAAWAAARAAWVAEQDTQTSWPAAWSAGAAAKDAAALAATQAAWAAHAAASAAAEDAAAQASWIAAAAAAEELAANACNAGMYHYECARLVRDLIPCPTPAPR